MADAEPHPSPVAGSSVAASRGGFRLRLRRDGDEPTPPGGGGGGGWSRRWESRRFRWLIYGLGGLLLAMLLFWALLIRGLPDAKTLVDYEPPLPTIVRDVSGAPTHSFARERRVQLEYDEFPRQLIQAFLAAEDKSFFSHSGVDFAGVAQAVVDYTSKVGSGERARGGSTITQQVAKNVLLGDEYSITRKLKEMVLAFRIESVLSKQEILALYLNEIPLGRRSFGVQAAAQAYFNKDVADLTLPEVAFLATLPKAPETYGRVQNERAALGRRAYVLGEMADEGFITAAERDAANAAPLGLAPTRGSQFSEAGGYYMEEVRRELVERFGENAENGPHSVYGGGLWVRTAFDPRLQAAAETAMRRAMLRYHAGRGWTGPVGRIEPGRDWAQKLRSTFLTIDYDNWRVATVVTKAGGAATIGFADGTTGRLGAGDAGMAARGGGTAFSKLRAGDLILVKRIAGNSYALRTAPGISGGFVAQSPASGRVFAMQGGFDSNLQSFNRATQAQRQPGSTIKPFVYATALDNGLTPSSIIVDAPFCVDQSRELGQKCFRNSGGGAAGPRTMRWGLEQSRNLMTVRTASQVGMPAVVRTFQNMGLGRYPPYLAFALGAGETTVAKMTNAYSMLVNQGRELRPHLIDVVQDRRGRVIYPANWRACDGCNAQDWDGSAMPRFEPTGKQLMDPVTAYQVVHMLEGVVQRGTATMLLDLDRPLFGKTGTTSGPTDVWFVGGTPQWVAGVYLGYDQPRPLGGSAFGGTLAAPIFEEFARVATVGQPKTPFIAPLGTRMVRIERSSGKRVYGAFPTADNDAIIWEAFKASSEPRRSVRREEVAQAPAGARAPQRQRAATTARTQRPSTRSQQDFADRDGSGGIY